MLEIVTVEDAPGRGRGPRGGEDGGASWLGALYGGAGAEGDVNEGPIATPYPTTTATTTTTTMAASAVSAVGAGAVPVRGHKRIQRVNKISAGSVFGEAEFFLRRPYR